MRILALASANKTRLVMLSIAATTILSLTACLGGLTDGSSMLTASPTSLSFTSIVPKKVLISNNMPEATAGNLDVVLTGTNESAFLIESNTCNGASLAYNKTCSFYVSVKPAAATASSLNATAQVNCSPCLVGANVDLSYTKPTL